ncbi:tigger transposable element-derived protein 1-like [Palaemon carinicauda]|uniref:tigger transposable element-derived protein 1-like n=1 Tax=Palaemon carinicauda TaxID=392227 RepID=UPI0035B5E05F
MLAALAFLNPGQVTVRTVVVCDTYITSLAMGPQKVTDVKGKKRMMLSMKMKMDIIKKYEAGMWLSVLTKEYGRNLSTIGTILKQKEAIKAATPSKGVTVFSSKRSHVHNEMERLLLVWIKEKGMVGDTNTEAIISHKPSAICGDPLLAHAKADTGGGTLKQEPPEFKASHGWGNCKVKPLLVYHSDTPRPFKTKKVTKENLNVLWRANGKAWVTRRLFIEWINICFGRTVKKYLEEKHLLMKCLLVLENAPAHPLFLHEDIVAQYSFIKILYLPPNTTPLLQPMDQQVISIFKKLYTKYLFKRCFDIIDSTNLILHQFWKEHFDIVICLKMIDRAWQEVSRSTLNSAWKKLWPDAASARDFKGFHADQTEDDFKNVEDPETVAQSEVAEIITFGKSMGLKVDEADIDELIEEHQEELTMDDLKELENMRVNVIQEEYSRGQGEDDPLTMAESKEGLDSYFKMVALVEKTPQKNSHRLCT